MRLFTHPKRVLAIALTGFVLFASGPFSAASAESLEGYEVVSLKRPAWVKRSGSRSTSSLQKGDILKDGDELEILKGNSAVLSADRERKNLVFVEEGTTLKIQGTHRRKDVRLAEGKVYVWLGHLEEGSSFRVVADSGIAAVRGTQFQVRAFGDKTEIMSYEGSVEIYQRGADGVPSKESAELTDGKKIVIEGFEKQALVPVAMTQDERAALEALSQEVRRHSQHLKALEAPSDDSELLIQAADEAEEEEQKLVVESYFEDKP